MYLSDVLTGDDITLTRKGSDTTKNLVRLTYSNRDKKYDRAVANSENELSATETGKRETQASMVHCCRGELAASLATTYLQRNLECPFEITFQSSIKYFKTYHRLRGHYHGRHDRDGVHREGHQHIS